MLLCGIGFESAALTALLAVHYKHRRPSKMASAILARIEQCAIIFEPPAFSASTNRLFAKH
jgi:hypothetical protein